MSHLHVYINGTPGLQDGTEVTNITLKNLLNAYKGNALAPSTTYTTRASRNPIFIPISVRMEDGYKATSVKISTTVDKNLYYEIFVMSSGSSVWGYRTLPTNAYDSSYMFSFYQRDSNNGMELIRDSAQFNSTNGYYLTNTNCTFFIEVLCRYDVTSIPENSPLFSLSVTEEPI